MEIFKTEKWTKRVNLYVAKNSTTRAKMKIRGKRNESTGKRNKADKVK